MDRIRAGLTGLGLVFIFTLIASLLLQPGHNGEPMKSGELLAQLGVAPSSDSASRSSTRPKSDHDFDPSDFTIDDRVLPEADPSAPQPSMEDSEALARSTAQGSSGTGTPAADHIASLTPATGHIA